MALHPLKSNDGADQIELALVSAVATVLVIRGYLRLTGYPKVGNGELHIAHLLYGGLFMLLAVFLLLVLLNTGTRWYAALLAGIGFGFFIDEIGRFISKDVNYFFKPAVAVMYAVFMVLFLALGALRRWRVATRPRDALASALTLLAGAAGRPLDMTTRTTVSSLLDDADPRDPVVRGDHAAVRLLPRPVRGPLGAGDRPALLSRAALPDPARGGPDLHGPARGSGRPQRCQTRRTATRGRLTMEEAP